MAPVIDGLSDRGLLGREGARGRGRSGRLVLSDAGAALLGAASPDVLATNPAFARPGTAQAGPVNEALLHFLAQHTDFEP